MASDIEVEPTLFCLDGDWYLGIPGPTEQAPPWPQCRLYLKPALRFKREPIMLPGGQVVVPDVTWDVPGDYLWLDPDRISAVCGITDSVRKLWRETLARKAGLAMPQDFPRGSV